MPKPGLIIRTEDIEFLVVFSTEIQRLKEMKRFEEMQEIQHLLIDMLMSPEFLEHVGLS